jgi:hypothetical protein
MRTVGSVSAFAVLMASITALCYLTYFEPGSSSSQTKPGVATVIETRSSIPEQYLSVNDLRQNDGVSPNHSFPIDGAIKRTLGDPDSISEKEPVAMTASERKTLMYAIKTMHDPFNNAQ